jgi:Dolichyl-phosphate-mannose-protein mannosyltransferase
MITNIHTFAENKRVKFFLFLAVFLTLFYSYELNRRTNYPPQSVHCWRQADGTAQALNYYQNNLQFWKPGVLNVIANNHHTVGEFPIFYWLSAVLYKIFGVQEWILKSIHLLVFFIGIYHLFKLSDVLLQNTLAALAIALLPFTTPVVAFYSLNFLPNVPALGLAFSGWYYFYKYVKDSKLKDWYICTSIFLLIALLKPTVLIGWIAIMVLYKIDLLRSYFFKNEPPLFKQKWKMLPSFFLIIIAIIAWRVWSNHYNIAAGSKFFFLDTIMPIWDMDATFRASITGWLTHDGLPIHVFTKTSLQILAAILVLNFILIQKQNKILFSILILNLLGVIAVILLWYQQLMVHDYYYIEWMVVPTSMIICLFYVFKQFNNKHLYHLLTVLMCCFLIKNFWHTKKEIFHRYDRNGDFYNGYNYSLFKTPELQLFFKGLGISERDTVLSAPDVSPNASLYWMRLRGFTNWNTTLDRYKSLTPYKGHITSRYVDDIIKNHGCKYLILSNLKCQEADTLRPYRNDLLGVFDSSVYVYRLHK